MQNLGNVIAGMYHPFTFETLTFTSSVTPLTASIYHPASSRQIYQVQYAVLTLDSGSATIRYTFDGTTPVAATTGHQLTAGSAMVLAGYAAITQFQAVSDTGSSATLQITYER